MPCGAPDRLGMLVLTDPRGRELRSVPPAAKVADDPVAALAERAESAGVVIDEQTNMPKWDGEAPDYEACIDAVRTRPGAPRAREV